jgi:hypothetical protein
LTIKGKNIKFNTWLNLFFLTLEYLFCKLNELCNTENSPLLLPVSPIKKRDFKDFTSSLLSGINDSKLNTSNNLLEMKDFSKILKVKANLNENKFNLDSSESKINRIPNKQEVYIYDINSKIKNEKEEGKEFFQILHVLQTYSNMSNGNILKYDLNNIINSIFKKVPNHHLNNKTFKIKTDAFGLDKFKQKRKMLPNFAVEITYQII